MNFACTALVSLPIVKRNINPVAHKHVTLYVNLDPCIVASHQKILIPVETGVIVVADVKYVMRQIYGVLIIHILVLIAVMAKIIPRFPYASFFPLPPQVICKIIPNFGRVKM